MRSKVAVNTAWTATDDCFDWYMGNICQSERHLPRHIITCSEQASVGIAQWLVWSVVIRLTRARIPVSTVEQPFCYISIHLGRLKYVLFSATFMPLCSGRSLSLL